MKGKLCYLLNLTIDWPTYTLDICWHIDVAKVTTAREKGKENPPRPLCVHTLIITHTFHYDSFSRYISANCSYKYMTGVYYSMYHAIQHNLNSWHSGWEWSAHGKIHWIWRRRRENKINVQKSSKWRTISSETLTTLMHTKKKSTNNNSLCLWGKRWVIICSVDARTQLHTTYI